MAIDTDRTRSHDHHHPRPSFDELRDTEFSRLDETSQTYLDYTGAGLYPHSLLHKHYNLLNHHVFGNPHSSNPTSAASSQLLSDTRQQILSFFRADDSYVVIFAANATAAIKLVAESFPFSSGSTLALLQDNHNSVNGIREYARRAGAKLVTLPLDAELRASRDDCEALLHRHRAEKPSLFCYPAQSNFSGVKHGTRLARVAHRHGFRVLLDAAAYVPSTRLHARTSGADFIPVSFYKLFGLPTGLGALIAKKNAVRMLRRPWFAGGTVRFASVEHGRHVLQEAPEAFEDGTVNFLSIAAVSRGLKFLNGVGMRNVTEHVSSLTGRLLEGLLAMRYDSGRRMTVIYGPKDVRDRGGTVAFNVLDRSGRRVRPDRVEAAANELNISLRTGCFCNPGAAERAGVVDGEQAAKCFRQGDFMSCLDESRVNFGAIRVSVGVANVKRDVDVLIDFLEGFCEEL